MIQAQSAREPSRAYRDVFDRVDAPSLREFYERGVFLWKRLYQGDEPWREIASPTVADPRARRELFRMNTARSVSEEIASLVWGEGMPNWVSASQVPELMAILNGTPFNPGNIDVSMPQVPPMGDPMPQVPPFGGQQPTQPTPYGQGTPNQSSRCRAWFPQSTKKPSM